MAATELDSFICKFNQLWHAGLTAHLDLDTHAGSTWVGLHVQFGHVALGPSHQHQQPDQHHSSHKVGLSRQRRRARRSAAREKMSTTAAAGKAVEGSVVECVETKENTEETDFTEKVKTSANEIENIDEKLEHDTKEVDLDDAGNATNKKFECPFVTLRAPGGLKAHMDEIHSNIEQLDGHDELKNDNKYKNTEYF